MSDPQSLGLGELGQRVQAMSDPATDPRLRPYQGAPLPIGAGPNGAGSNGTSSSASNGRPIPEYERAEEPRATQQTQPSPQPATPAALQDLAYPPANSFASPQPSPYPAPAAGPTLHPFSTQPFGQTPTPASVTFRVSDRVSERVSDLPPAEAPASSWESIATPPTSPDPAPAPAPAAPASHAVAPSANPATPSGANPEASKSGLQRAIDAVRSAIPVVQKLLPLLDGNFATAISALVAPQAFHHPPPAPPVVHVDLEPVERGLAEVRNSHRELRTQVQEQSTSLKRVEDQLERVREATDRNTLEQQELVEDLRSVGSRLSLFAILGLVLLAVSLVLNIYFLVQLQHILR
jgi:hypothetical protein